MLFMTFLLILSGYALVSFSIIPIPINVLGWNVPYLLSPDMVSEKTATAIHHYIAYALTSLILVHSFAALFHHFILKDKTLIRMLKKQNGGATLTN
jgi:cytochrome b561